MHTKPRATVRAQRLTWFHAPTLEHVHWLATLEQGLSRADRSAIYRVLRDAVPDFKGEAA